jgi:hypothetical protein
LRGGISIIHLSSNLVTYDQRLGTSSMGTICNLPTTTQHHAISALAAAQLSAACAFQLQLDLLLYASAAATRYSTFELQ